MNRFARLFSFSNRAAGLRLYPCDERPAMQQEVIVITPADRVMSVSAFPAGTRQLACLSSRQDAGLVSPSFPAPRPLSDREAT
jgi:hypothetical protein